MVGHYLRKIAFAGCRDIDDYRLLRCVLLINVICALAITVCSIMIVFYIAHGLYAYCLSCIPVCACYCVPYVLNHKRLFDRSKFIFMFSSIAFVIFGTALLGYASGLGYCLFTAVAVTFILYSPREAAPLLFFSAFSIGGVLAIELWREDYFAGARIFDPSLVGPVRILLLLVNISILALACYFIHGIIDELHVLLLKEKAAKIEQTKLSALAVMSAGIAHEINNPLAIICSRIEQVVYFLSSKTRERQSLAPLLQNVIHNAGRIGKIVKSLKMLSRRSSDDSYDPYSLNEIITSSLELCRENIFRYNIDVRYEPCPADLMVNCHPSELMQVILSLVGNAIDAICEREERWVEVRVVPTARSIELRITDSGPGIPRELHDKIMEPFFTTKEVGKGVGLGLSVSATIMESHRGSLRLDPEAKHTSFVATLPVAS